MGPDSGDVPEDYGRSNTLDARPGLDPGPSSVCNQRMRSGYWVYILTSRRNGTLYVGVTADLGRRVWQHREGVAEGFTRTYGVKRLVHVEPFGTLDDARRRERQLKCWRRAWKIQLIEAANPGWDDLYETLNV